MAAIDCSVAGHNVSWIPLTVLGRDTCTGQTPYPTGVSLLIMLSAIIFVTVHVP